MEFIGLTGTLTNILGFLNLAEFGIGSAISFFLYKPLQIADRGRISELISIFGYVYRKIGCMIGAGGIVVSLFFPLIFKQTPMEFGIIYFVFLLLSRFFTDRLLHQLSPGIVDCRSKELYCHCLFSNGQYY